MTTPTGTISLNDVNVELNKSGTTLITLNDTDVRTLAGVASGAISMDNLRGKTNRVTLSYTFSSNTANASLNLSAISGYISGKSDITVTINSGVYLYATLTSNYGLNLSGGTTGDTLTIINNGFIIGKGGQGGNYNVSTGEAGGPALNLGFGLSGCTINNTNASAYIAGGGGGGYGTGGGGGAGGGNGGTGYGGVAGGTGGGVGASGTNGSSANPIGAGGGGGRILPGTGGSAGVGTGGGGGGGAGGGGGGYYNGKTSYSGGAGGSGNAVGGGATGGGGGGGGWGASGTPSSSGAGGKAVNLNGKSITWTSGNTTRVYGSVS